MALWKIRRADSGDAHLAVGPAETGPTELLVGAHTVSSLLANTDGPFAEVLAAASREPLSGDYDVLAPLDDQEVWAAGVTYLKSRDARIEESDGLDFYDRVYVAERPEIFLKAGAGRTRGPGEPVGIRHDSSWSVPEPELAVVADATGAIVAYSIGNDLSSRSIEGENPLYLPQAKVYTASCAVGPCLVPVAEAAAVDDMTISLRITRGDGPCVDSKVGVAMMKRDVGQLVEWLFLANDFPTGAVLLTGTGIVPEGNFTLAEGDVVEIGISGLGVLCNPVIEVGKPR